MSFLDQNISAFKDVRSVDPVTVTIRQFLNSEKYRALIDQVRACDDKKQRDALKKGLPCATLSATFKKRVVEQVTSYNGIVCIDIDAKDNPGCDAQEMKARICAYSEVAYAAISVGGQGVFALVLTDLTDPAYHPRLCEVMERYFLHYADLRIDKACKDITRLRFVSYDTNAYINEAAVPTETAELVSKWQADDLLRLSAPPRARWVPDHPKPGSSTAERVEALISAIEHNRLDITTDYLNWINAGFAIISEFGASGEQLFQRLSSFHPKYDRLKTEEKYKNLIGKASGKVPIGTLFNIAAQHGIKL